MYCINPESDEPIFTLFDQIGASEDKPLEPYVDGNQFARELLYMDGEGKKRIQIWINCEGGSIKDGMSIIGAILKTKTRIDTLVVGIAYSMGGVIALMGKKKEIIDVGSLMLHYGYNPDNSQDETLKALNSGLISAIMSRTGKSEDEVNKVLAAETYYTCNPTGAQINIRTLGFEVIASNEENAPRNSNPKALHAIGMSYVNKFLAKNKSNQMEKSEICELLGLDPNVSDKVAMDSLKAFKAKADKVIQAKAKKDEDEDCTAEEKAAKKMKAENEEMKAKLAKVDEDKAKAEDEDKKAKAIATAKTAIEAKAKERNITDEKVIAKYVALSGGTPEGTATVIETIEAIPVTKTAAKINSVKSINSKADAIGIAMIGDGEEIEKDLSPGKTGIGAGDTSKFIQDINSFNYIKDWENRKRA